MKKFYMLFFIVLCALGLNAQTIDVIREGQAFSMISPSAKYIAGNIDDIAVYYNVETTEAAVLEGEIQDDGGCFVWDLNDKGELAVDHLKKAAIWTEDGGFDYLPEPEGLKKSEQKYSAARAITNDGKTVVVSFGDPTISVYVYTLSSDGIWDMVKLPMPKEDPIFHQPAQFAVPMGINDAATRIMGRYRIDTGLEELPFAWEKNANGEWEIRWVALDFIVEGGETDAVYPGDFEFNGAGLDVSSGEWQEEYDKAYAEYEQMWVDYETIIKALATGYYYNGAGSLSGMRLSPNGKYANVQISHEQTNATYPAVIDLDANTVHVFTCRPGGGCLSVTNNGEVSISGALDYFSMTYVSSIADPTKDMTLAEYTLSRTENKINLAEYMTYETPNGAQLAEGTATLASNGVGYVTWQYNGFEGNQRYETFIVRYPSNLGVGNEVILNNQISIYPNPTEGVLNVSDKLENVRIMDITGRIVYSASTIESTIDLSDVAVGTYILVADKDGSRITTKVIVK